MQAKYISHYLTDNDVANFARQSFSKLADQFSTEQNNNLIKFLARGMSKGDWENIITEKLPLACTQSIQDRHDLAVYLRNIPEHWVPFGHPQITLRMTAPIPIKVQCFKHKIGFVESEESRRYISTTPEIYVPDPFRAKAENVKQGSGTALIEKLSITKIVPFLEEGTNKVSFKKTSDVGEIYIGHCNTAIELYQSMIKDGVCPEQARFILPQGVEANWVWTGSLYAYANFYNQRSDPHAQKEIQILAQQVNDIIAPLYPVSWGALTKGVY